LDSQLLLLRLGKANNSNKGGNMCMTDVKAPENLKSGLYFRYELYPNEEVVTKRVSQYSFDGRPWVKAHNKTASLGKIFVLKCQCRSNMWNENGRNINEYECQSCGQYISIIFTNHGLSGEGE
jgi:hypothetical protein